MSFYKALCNAIGSGAGVAYPIFGIVSGAIQSSIGDRISLTLGYFCLGLFAVITLGIFYYSYKEGAAKQRNGSAKLYSNQQKLLNSIHSYSTSCKELSVLEQIEAELKQEHLSPCLVKILHIMYLTYHKSPSLNLKDIMPLILKRQTNYRTKGPQVAAFFGFVGSFGSIAGSGAGLFGLLTGTGFFAGFAVFPLFAWSIVATAMISGVVGAAIFYKSARKEEFLESLNSTIETMYNQLDESILQRDSHYVLSRRLTNLGVQPTKELMAELNKPVMDYLNKKNQRDYLIGERRSIKPSCGLVLT